MGRKKKNNWKNRDGIVFSTSDSYEYNEYGDEETTTPDPSDQRLKIHFEKRKGKSVTLIEGFEGTTEDLKDLGKALRNHCGVGGSAKDETILLQGDFRDKARAYLSSEGYNVR